MMYSLQVKFLLVTLTISVLAIGAIAFFSNRSTKTEFRRFIEANDETRMERIRDLLTEHYAKTSDWSQAQSALEQVGKIGGQQLALLDAQGQIIAAWPPELLQAEITRSPDNRFTMRRRVVKEEASANEERVRVIGEEELVLVNPPHLIFLNATGELTATLYLLPPPPTEQADEQKVFFASVDRALIVAVVSIALAVLVATLILSGRILRPVASLTRAAQLMEKGDLEQRVETRSKDEIGQLAQAFNAMADSLARTERLRRNMVSDIAHELRTPLTNIRCQIETLQDGLAQASPAMLASLHEEAMLLNHLIDDLQELALADAGQLRLHCAPLGIDEAIGNAVSAIKQQADSKEVTINLDLPEELPAVHADDKRVGQILRNLLANAITYTPAAGRIRVQARQAESAIAVTVEDNGAGIAPEHLPNIFERFYRADGARARATGGAGLGLAIVKQLVEAHGGQIRVESAAGSRTAFTFTLPIHQP